MRAETIILRCSVVAGAFLTMAISAAAHTFGSIDDLAWSADESRFVLRHSADDIAGYDHVDLYDTRSGKRLRRRGGGYGDRSEARRVSTRATSAAKRLAAELKTSPGKTLAPDPSTYSDLEWPGWPDPPKRRYTQKIALGSQTLTLVLRTYAGTGKDDPEVAYKLFVRRPGDGKARLLAKWRRTSDDDETLFRTLGGVQLSPSGQMIAVVLREWQEGFEGPDVMARPIFLTRDAVLGTGEP